MTPEHQHGHHCPCCLEHRLDAALARIAIIEAAVAALIAEGKRVVGIDVQPSPPVPHS